jgi:hypothetical protein
MSNLGKNLAQYWNSIQSSLFPWLEEELDPLTKKNKQLIISLEMIRIEKFIPESWFGRPTKFRIAIARSFIAKSVYNFVTTRALIDRLMIDINLRRICGFENKRHIPSEATFSRAFEEFAKSGLPQRVHKALIKQICKENIIQHISNDSTAIIAREKPQYKKKEEQKEAKYKRGRPKKGEIREDKIEINRLDLQPKMSLDEMLKELPKLCDVGSKKNSQGYIETWIGYKFHIAAADGGIPISAILTSASLHDSQAAIPLMTQSSETAINLYDLFDAAYYDDRIEDYSRFLKHVPIIDVNPRRNAQLKNELETEAKARKNLNWKMPEEIRYNERTTVERVNARLKDEFGGRTVRVKGTNKVMCHLMFGLLALTVDQLMCLIT